MEKQTLTMDTASYFVNGKYNGFLVGGKKVEEEKIEEFFMDETEANNRKSYWDNKINALGHKMGSYCMVIDLVENRKSKERAAKWKPIDYEELGIDPYTLSSFCTGCNVIITYLETDERGRQITSTVTENYNSIVEVVERMSELRDSMLFKKINIKEANNDKRIINISTSTNFGWEGQKYSLGAAESDMSYPDYEEDINDWNEGR